MPSITLKNPLDYFASYSIHHILLACRTTEEAKVFMSEAENGPTLAAIEQVASLGDAVPIGGGKSAFLVIDTRRFSQYSVEKFEYEVFINGLEKATAHGNIATTVNMTVSDTVGISFINFIQWLMNEKMETNFDGMIFMHRVVFVGHNPNGKTETVQSVTIPMHLHKMELNLDASKGTYDLQFMPNMNFDVREHNRWVNISNASKYFTGETTNTLGAIVDSFEAELNKGSEAYYTQVQAAMAGRTQEGGKYGRKVRYQITLPGRWRDMELVGASTGDATETVFSAKRIGRILKAEEDRAETAAQAADRKTDEEAKKRRDAEAKANAKKAGAAPPEKVAGKPKSTNISVNNDRQITAVLDLIFKQVPAIADLGTGRKVPGERGSVTFYKHFVGITSDDNDVVVHVDVVEFKVPNVVVDAKATVAKDDASFYQEVGPYKARRPANYIEFDYIFSGKNKDVLNFDMKLQDLQWMLASNLNLGPGVDGVVEKVRTGETPTKEAIDQRADLILTRPYDAILPPRSTEDELKNFANYTELLSRDTTLAAVKSANDYMSNLSMYYAMAPITAILTIRGNPLVMAKFNQNFFLPHPPVAAGASATGTEQDDITPAYGPHAEYRRRFQREILQNNAHTDAAGNAVSEMTNANGTFVVANTLGSDNYASAPVFVTVNVFGPHSRTYPGQKAAENGEYAQKLLTDNFYVVFKLKNRIEGNVFTQELELYSHNVFGPGKAPIQG